ncbi:DUF4349 domain-containing protein [Diaminobutyricimonas sp. LJ205]|uniref:DUF4349 domain-containing protein n=1 Tax=Diaminobutyricimonas sp. LJ205 TaxID=2683590 RepID=UPI0012F4CA9E|nr:DUF4349 domain-containing protein [Diaminobutyricimonas sp. LJ205]
MRRVLVAAAVLIGALSLSGCVASPMNGSGSDSGGVTSEEFAPGVPAPDGPVRDSDGSTVDQSARDREIIMTGQMTVVVDEPTDAADEATDIVEAADGRIDSRTERAATEQNRGSATLLMRIPADRLTAVLEDIEALGDPRETSISSEDVTVVTQDLDARITALQASVDRLLALMATATDTSTLIEVEQALSSRQAELESLQSQRRYYSDQVALATITLNLVSEQEAVPEQPDTFLSGLIAGWEALVGFFGGLLVLAGVLLPWLVVLGVLALLVIFIVRTTRRRTVASTPVENVE